MTSPIVAGRTATATGPGLAQGEGAGPALASSEGAVDPMTPVLNVPLLRKVVEHIEAHPEEWDQSDYRCKTGMCVAGWACELAGGEWYDADLSSTWSSYLIAEDGDYGPVAFGDTTIVSAHDRAARLLGMHPGHATALFDAGNDLPTIRRIADRLIASAEAQP